MMTLNKTKFMTNKTWKVMNDLEEAFNQITTFEFLLEQLQEAVNTNNTQRIVDTTAALTAFYTPYCNNWDDKFTSAWNKIIRNEPNSTHDTSSVDENLTDKDWEDFWNSFCEERQKP
jgi:hypothetical protein